jgi:response regulator NasT
LRVMLLDDDRGRVAILEQALRDAGHEVVAKLRPGDPLLARTQALNPDIIIADMDVPDRDTLESMATISRDRPRPIVMFAERSDPEMAREAIRVGVSAYVVDGLSPNRVKPIIEVAIARFREFQALRVELEETRGKLAERKVVEQAKGILMQRRGLNEEDAYRTLRKMAMNSGQRIGEVARNLVAMAELLL